MVPSLGSDNASRAYSDPFPKAIASCFPFMVSKPTDPSLNP